MKKSKGQRGITLIALIITIIVLLILAGISITILTGQNGILNKANTAKEENLIRSYREQLDLIWQGEKVENFNNNLNYEKLLELCKNKIEQDVNFEGANVEIVDNMIVVTTKEGYIFHIIEGKTEYAGKEGEEKGLITVGLTASELQNKKVSFTAKAENANGRKLTYVMYVNNVEKQRETTFRTTFISEEQTTNFGDILAVRVEIEYDAKNVASSNEVIIEDNTIANKEELEQFRDNVNEKQISYENKKVEVIQNIDLQGSQTNQWIPIGNEANPFKGIFNGNYHIIDNVYINVPDGVNKGLFGVTLNATIQNTILEHINIKVENGTLVGGIVGKCEASTIERCGTNGEISGCNWVGGIAGAAGYLEVNKVKINQCYNKATIILRMPKNNSNIGYVGGITGGLNYETEINYCYNFGKIDSNGAWTGGITGTTTRGGKIKNCYNIGEMIVEPNREEYVSHIGGISGNMYYASNYGKKICEAINCYNVGNIVCKNSGKADVNVGGILGTVETGYGKISNCYNQANVTTTTSSKAYVGGITGRIYNFEQTTVTNCSTIMATAIGRNESTNATITNVLGGQTKLPSILSVVNTSGNGEFVEDSNHINRGYPILKWETGEP